MFKLLDIIINYLSYILDIYNIKIKININNIIKLNNIIMILNINIYYI